MGRVLQAYLDGCVQQPAAGRLDEHFAHCRDCGLEIEVYRQLKQSLRRSGPEVPPAALDRLRRFAAELGGKG
ncbi:MAG: zf-HC2 domain-containing protein [Actinomycetota bacterium]|nr:zf-HC2 domain-containing protein [Actinomycetota bacterium]